MANIAQLKLISESVYTPQAPVGTYIAAEASPPGFSSFPIDNSFILNGDPAPGQWLLMSGTKEFLLQIQQGFALSGAAVVGMGAKPVVATFTGKLWTNAQAEQFDTFRKKYFATPVLPGSQSVPATFTATQDTTATVGAVSSSYGISHTELNALGVDSVIVKEVTPLIQQEGGLWTTTVTFVQFRPVKAAVSKPNAQTPGVAGNGGPAVTFNGQTLTGAKAVIANLTAEVNAQNSIIASVPAGITPPGS